MILSETKKGVSAVVATVIMIALVIAVVLIVWKMVFKIVKEETAGAESCFGIFDKISINDYYTCYNYSSKELRLAISRKDIDIDELLISISDGEGNSQSFKISSQPLSEPYIRVSSGEVKLPGKNSGVSYFIDTAGLGMGKPEVVKIAPIVNGKQCEVSDSLSKIDGCNIFAT